MKNLLCISIAAPPKSGPESLQTGKYLKGLSKYFKIDLVTTRATNYGWNKKIGQEEELLTPYVDSIIELKDYTDRISSKIKSWLPHNIKFPDDHFHFHKSASYITNNLINEPDVVYSRSSPLSSAILAAKIKDQIKKPWIMHLSDPWTDNPFLKFNREKNEEWEEICMSKADMVTVTNDNYLAFLKTKYPNLQHKFELSYNVYAPVEVEPIDFFRPFKLVFFGNFYGDRNPAVLLEPLYLIYTKSPQEFENVKVSFYGNLDTSAEQIIEKYNLPFVEHKGFVPQNRIPEIAEDATILINIEDPFEELTEILFLPSKIMDYISYQKLILSISSNRSPSKTIIDNNYGQVFEHDNVSRIVNFIKDAIKAYIGKDNSFFQVNPPNQLYSSDYQTEKLAQKILKLI